MHGTRDRKRRHPFPSPKGTYQEGGVLDRRMGEQMNKWPAASPKRGEKVKEKKERNSAKDKSPLLNPQSETQPHRSGARNIHTSLPLHLHPESISRARTVTTHPDKVAQA